jgi:hypothetical protein
MALGIDRNNMGYTPTADRGMATDQEKTNLQFMLDNPERFASELQSVDYSRYPDTMRPAPLTNEDAFANPDQTSGYWDDSSAVTLWNPATQSYETQNVNPDDPFEFNPRGSEYGYYYNSQGDYVLGRTPDGELPGTSPSGDPGVVYENLVPEWLGGEVTDSGINRENGGPNYSNGPPTPNPDYVAPGAGNISPIGGAPMDGNAPLPPPRPLVNDTLGQGGGAVGGVATNPYSDVQGSDLNKFGYESSSNKDFYQRQFADLRAQQMRQQNAEGQAQQAGAAAQQAQAGQEAFGGDPWSWANLPEVQVSQGAGTGPRTLDVGYEGLNNADAFARASPYLSEGAQEWFPRLMSDNANTGSDTEWAGAGYDANLNNTSTGGLAPSGQGFMRELYNTMYTSPAGGDIPAGYASPTNAPIA